MPSCAACRGPFWTPCGPAWMRSRGKWARRLAQPGLVHRHPSCQSLLSRWVAASRTGNPRSASGLTAPEVEVVLGKEPAAQHETRAGSQQVLGEQLLGEFVRVYPDTGLKARIQRGVLRTEPRLTTRCISQPAAPSINHAEWSPGCFPGFAEVSLRAGPRCGCIQYRKATAGASHRQPPPECPAFALIP